MLHCFSFEFHCLPSKLCCLTSLKFAQCCLSSSKTWWYLLASSKTWWHLFASLKFGLNCLSVKLDHFKSSKFWCHLLAYLNFERCHPISLKSSTHHFISRSQCTSITKMPMHILRLLHRQLLHCNDANAHPCFDKLYL